VPHFSLLLREVGLRIRTAPISPTVGKCKRPRQETRPSREPISRYPVKVTFIIDTAPPKNQVTLRRRCRLKKQTAPKLPRPFAKNRKSVPCQGNVIIIEAIRRQIKLLSGGPPPCPANPPLSLRDILYQEEWTWRDSNPHPYLGKELCCRYTTGPRANAYFSQGISLGPLA
jgi:hypothetical protein